MDNKIFFNRPFDKGRLKSLILWSLNNSGEKNTLQLVEYLKEIGFNYATKAGLSLGIDDLRVPDTKKTILSKAELEIQFSNQQYEIGNLTAVERFQKVIDTWHKTSELLKQNVIKNFRNTDQLNPIYMMAFSGARGNISQVRQLVGMRGLMADPQGQILDFPIRSNFKEGLTLTEYIISCYGARKGLVDTALRTANSGYLTRRLVDVAQHIIVRQLDCETKKGLLLRELKDGKKTILSLQNRLIGRVLAEPIENCAYKNQDISPSLAAKLATIKKEILVRSPLTCEAKNSICQLCYGWSLAHGTIVSLGEAVGILAAQSIGEPGTQLTMRTFHTGGVFSGDIMDEIIAPENGQILFSTSLQGLLIRTLHGKIAFLTKEEGQINFISQNNQTNLPFFIPSGTILYVRQNEFVKEKQILAEFSSALNIKNQGIQSKYDFHSEKEGQIYFETISLIEKRGKDENFIRTATKFGSIWLLAGEIYQSNFSSSIFTKIGDRINKKTILHQSSLLNPYNSIIDPIFPQPIFTRTLKKKDRYLKLKEIFLKKQFLSLSLQQITYKKFGYFSSFNSNTEQIFFSKSFAEYIKNPKSISINWFPKQFHLLNERIVLTGPLLSDPDTNLGQILSLQDSLSHRGLEKLKVLPIQYNSYLQNGISQKNWITKLYPSYHLSNSIKKNIFYKKYCFFSKKNETDRKNTLKFLSNPFNKNTNIITKISCPSNDLFTRKKRNLHFSKINNFKNWNTKKKFFKNHINELKKNHYQLGKKNKWIYFPKNQNKSFLKNYQIYFPGQNWQDDIIFDKKFLFSEIVILSKNSICSRKIRQKFFVISSKKPVFSKQQISNFYINKNKKKFHPRFFIQVCNLKEFYLLNKKRNKNLFYTKSKNKDFLKSLVPYLPNLNKQIQNRLFFPDPGIDISLFSNISSNRFIKKTKTSSYLINFSISLKLTETYPFKESKIQLTKKKLVQFAIGNKMELPVYIKNQLKKKKNFEYSKTKILLNKNNYSCENYALTLTSFNSNYTGEIVKFDKTHKTKVLFLTPRDKISFSLENKNFLYTLGTLIRYGDEFILKSGSIESGQVISINKKHITLRRANPILLSAQGVFHVQHGDLIEKNSQLATLFYQRLKTGDIVQGIPKIEELFEARQTKEGEILPENIHIKAKLFFESYKKQYTPQEAARKSIEKIQQILIEGVQQVYQSQGVTIADKHIEIIVRQMTSKVKVIEGGRTGLLRGELVDLEWIEIVNLGIESQNKFISQEFDLQKAEYEPVILGITKTSLETESFISAASFQETTRILSRAAIEQKTDFLRGLKENVILGHLIPAGTGFSLSFDPQIQISGGLINMSSLNYRDMIQLFSSHFSTE